MQNAARSCFPQATGRIGIALTKGTVKISKPAALYKIGDQHFVINDKAWFAAHQKTDGAIALAIIEKRITPINNR
jgi:hypothetical protein